MSPVPIPRFVEVPGGVATIGTTAEQIDAVASEWASRLIDPSYTRDDLASWLRKEHPAHQCDIAPFHLGWGPVTNAEYGAFVQATGAPPSASLRDADPGDHPVWGVTLGDAERYCAWLSSVAGTEHRLPTEAEWEWAAAGPGRLQYPWGDRFDRARCNTAETGLSATTPVGAYPSGAAWCGAVDLAGNVEEWTSTRYHPYPGGEPVSDHLAAANPEGYHVLRGGSCALGGDAARTARRHGPIGGDRFKYRGFRVAR